MVRISKDALEIFQIKKSDALLVLGDIERGIELLPVDKLWEDNIRKYAGNDIFYCKS